mmetsp:Transcript_22607/g.39790  ORF Transcript_22607/g.39790 Transcript_22607/m.39790 type:complete len:342 (+) Transcript_22607:1045-2070(+)
MSPLAVGEGARSTRELNQVFDLFAPLAIRIGIVTVTVGSAIDTGADADDERKVLRLPIGCVVDHASSVRTVQEELQRAAPVGGVGAADPIAAVIDHLKFVTSWGEAPPSGVGGFVGVVGSGGRTTGQLGVGLRVDELPSRFESVIVSSERDLELRLVLAASGLAAVVLINGFTHEVGVHERNAVGIPGVLLGDRRILIVVLLVLGPLVVVILEFARRLETGVFILLVVTQVLINVNLVLILDYLPDDVLVGPLIKIFFHHLPRLLVDEESPVHVDIKIIRGEIFNLLADLLDSLASQRNGASIGCHGEKDSSLHHVLCVYFHNNYEPIGGSWVGCCLPMAQ